MEKNSKIYVSGHTGMVGSAICRKLEKEGYSNIVVKTSKELDLRNQTAVNAFFEKEKPEYVFLAAAKVGGIIANNTFRAEFIYDNLCIQNSIIHSAYIHKTKKLLFLGSSCIYPKQCPQPIKEEYILSGYLEPTNEPYAIAKIAGIKMCEAYRDQYGCNFISAMPTNLYGPNDNYNLNNSHVLPALLSKFHTAKIKNEPSVMVWGSGKPQREFLHVNDMVDACMFLMESYNEKEIVNIGCGKDISIKDLAFLIKNVTGFKGEINFDSTKPDGTMQKLLDVAKINALGWKYSIELNEGIANVYEEFKNNLSENNN